MSFIFKFFCFFSDGELYVDIPVKNENDEVYDGEYINSEAYKPGKFFSYYLRTFAFLIFTHFFGNLKRHILKYFND